MTEFLKSFSSMSLALAFLPIRQMEDMLRTGTNRRNDDPTVRTMDSITTTTVENFGGSLRKTFCVIDHAQRAAIDRGAKVLWPFRGREAVENSVGGGNMDNGEKRADFHLRL